MKKELFWTAEIPTEQGWYWLDTGERWAHNGITDPVMAQIVADEEGNLVVKVGIKEHFHALQHSDMKAFPYRWAGPIELPERPVNG